MIELRHVTKRYGAVEALHDVSFRAPEGQIVGLLGQNGAGKSTTLNILTGYLPPTSGQVLVDGMDLLQNARECKRLIGYLPEKPPLYDEMTVRAYLRFVCELKEVQKSAIAAHVEDIIRTCGLSGSGASPDWAFVEGLPPACRRSAVAVRQSEGAGAG